MSLRVCAHRGCPVLVRPGVGRCAKHRREFERARGSSTDRGYDYSHQQERKDWQRRLDQGEVILCRRAPYGLCRAPDPVIDRDPTSWDLGHPDDECPAPKAPEHRGLCNRPTATRRGGGYPLKTGQI